MNTKKVKKVIIISSSTVNIRRSSNDCSYNNFFINIYKAVVKYYPTQYSPADVNFLFMSPMSSRTIYAFSIAKQVIITFLIIFSKTTSMKLGISIYLILAGTTLVIAEVLEKAIKIKKENDLTN
ncbi:hypothetical protein I6U48_06140 [Clostridium sp. PL3]|uniref:Uncharacterized protein n=1 Tax=Clostridium thailandense TaxID=2794346 RepID=A0A949WQA8_9CLOT|nr:hypothetical protein [Clostridium thailandense]